MISKGAARVCPSPAYELTGQPRDPETGLDDFGFRYNSSTLGRFMTPDPAGNLVASPADPQSWNQYAYVMNNPTTWTDPNGLDPGDNQFQRPAGEGCLNDPYGEDPKIFDACGGFAGFAGGGAAWNVFQIDPFSLIGINAKVTDPFELPDFSDPTLLSAVDLSTMSNEHGVATSYGIFPASPLPPMPLGSVFTLFGSEPGASAGGSMQSSPVSSAGIPVRPPSFLPLAPTRGPLPTRRYLDQVSCVAAHLALQDKNHVGMALTINVAPLYFATGGNEVAAWRAFGAAAIFDLGFAWRTREAYVKEVYGPNAE